jgi:hypothetical protein
MTTTIIAMSHYKQRGDLLIFPDRSLTYSLTLESSMRRTQLKAWHRFVHRVPNSDTEISASLNTSILHKPCKPIWLNSYSEDTHANHKHFCYIAQPSWPKSEQQMKNHKKINKPTKSIHLTAILSLSWEQLLLNDYASWLLQAHLQHWTFRIRWLQLL